MSNPAELFAGMGAVSVTETTQYAIYLFLFVFFLKPRMDATEIQTKIAKAVQQKELGNQCVANNDLSKALYHYHYGNVFTCDR